jgi:hypothetical protein
VRHLGRAARDLLRGGLRRGDQEELGLRQELGERHGDVAGARGQVHEQVVQLAPLDVLEELGEGLVEHGPAPDDGGVLGDEEADGHDLHAVGHEREDLALGRDGRALGAEAEHARDGVAPDVASRMPTFLPSAASAAAMFEVSVDLPTPPLPDRCR